MEFVKRGAPITAPLREVSTVAQQQSADTSARRQLSVLGTASRLYHSFVYGSKSPWDLGANSHTYTSHLDETASTSAQQPVPEAATPVYWEISEDMREAQIARANLPSALDSVSVPTESLLGKSPEQLANNNQSVLPYGQAEPDKRILAAQASVAARAARPQRQIGKYPLRSGIKWHTDQPWALDKILEPVGEAVQMASVYIAHAGMDIAHGVAKWFVERQDFKHEPISQFSTTNESGNTVRYSVAFGQGRKLNNLIDDVDNYLADPTRDNVLVVIEETIGKMAGIKTTTDAKVHIIIDDGETPPYTANLKDTADIVTGYGKIQTTVSKLYKMSRISPTMSREDYMRLHDALGNLNQEKRSSEYYRRLMKKLNYAEAKIPKETGLTFSAKSPEGRKNYAVLLTNGWNRERFLEIVEDNVNGKGYLYIRPATGNLLPPRTFNPADYISADGVVNLYPEDVNNILLQEDNMLSYGELKQLADGVLDRLSQLQGVHGDSPTIAYFKEVLDLLTEASIRIPIDFPSQAETERIYASEESGAALVNTSSPTYTSSSAVAASVVEMPTPPAITPTPAPPNRFRTLAAMQIR